MLSVSGLVVSSDCGCRYFSGDPAAGLPRLPRPDGSRRLDFERLLRRGSPRQRQYYQQYVRPATMRSFKQMQVRLARLLRGSDLAVPCLIALPM